MEKVKIKELRHYHFYFAVLELLERLGGSASVDEINATIIEKFKFTDDDLNQSYTKSRGLIIPDKISWARSYLKIAKLVSSGETRGVWVLTQDGRDILQKGEDAVNATVKVAVSKYNNEYRNKTPNSKEKNNSKNSKVENNNDEESNIEWNEILIQKLQSISPTAFERLCRRLLLESGFTKVEITDPSRDGGIDGYGILRVNLVSFHVLFQCKRYQGSVGSELIRNFRGAMQGRADKGIVITTGTFTSDARKEATRDGAPAIDLIDGEALAELLKLYKLGVKVKMVEDVSIDEGFFDAI